MMMSEQDFSNLTLQALNALEAKHLDRIRDLKAELKDVEGRLISIRKEVKYRFQSNQMSLF